MDMRNKEQIVSLILLLSVIIFGAAGCAEKTKTASDATSSYSSTESAYSPAESVSNV
jgi:hypothetical protein